MVSLPATAAWSVTIEHLRPRGSPGPGVIRGSEAQEGERPAVNRMAVGSIPTGAATNGSLA